MESGATPNLSLTAFLKSGEKSKTTSQPISKKYTPNINLDKFVMDYRKALGELPPHIKQEIDALEFASSPKEKENLKLKIANMLRLLIQINKDVQSVKRTSNDLRMIGRRRQILDQEIPKYKDKTISSIYTEYEKSEILQRKERETNIQTDSSLSLQSLSDEKADLEQPVILDKKTLSIDSKQDLDKLPKQRRKKQIKIVNPFIIAPVLFVIIAGVLYLIVRDEKVSKVKIVKSPVKSVGQAIISPAGQGEGAKSFEEQVLNIPKKDLRSIEPPKAPAITPSSDKLLGVGQVISATIEIEESTAIIEPTIKQEEEIIAPTAVPTDVQATPTNIPTKTIAKPENTATPKSKPTNTELPKSPVMSTQTPKAAASNASKISLHKGHIVDSDYIQLRRGPNESHPPTEKLYRGTVFIISMQDSNWVYAWTPRGVNGWLKSEGILPIEETPLILTSTVKLREGPGIDEPSKITLKTDTVIYKLLHSNGWYLIRTDADNIGWVFAAYTKPFTNN